MKPQDAWPPLGSGSPSDQGMVLGIAAAARQRRSAFLTAKRSFDKTRAEAR